MFTTLLRIVPLVYATSQLFHWLWTGRKNFPFINRSGRLPGAYFFSRETTGVFNRPYKVVEGIRRSRGRVLDVNFWFSRILGFLAESGPLHVYILLLWCNVMEENKTLSNHYKTFIRIVWGGGRHVSMCNDVIWWRKREMMWARGERLLLQATSIYENLSIKIH